MVNRMLVATAVLAVTVAVLLLGPIHATGVRGTALHPRYVSFYVGAWSYEPLPTGPQATNTVLKSLHITPPQTAVHRRLEGAVAAVAIGVVLCGAAVVRNRSGRREGVQQEDQQDH